MDAVAVGVRHGDGGRRMRRPYTMNRRGAARRARGRVPLRGERERYRRGRSQTGPLHYPAHRHPGTGAEACPDTSEGSKVTGWSGGGGVDVVGVGVRHGDGGRTVFPGRVAQPVFTL